MLLNQARSLRTGATLPACPRERALTGYQHLIAGAGEGEWAWATPPSSPNCHAWVSGPLRADIDLLSHKLRHCVNCDQGHSKAIAFKKSKWIWEQCELTDFDFSVSY